jgi:hypothetical protein
MLQKEILTTGQAARELGVTPLTVSRWCQAAHTGNQSPLKREECFRPGRDWKIRRGAVERLLGESVLSEPAAN